MTEDFPVTVRNEFSNQQANKSHCIITGRGVVVVAVVVVVVVMMMMMMMVEVVVMMVVVVVDRGFSGYRQKRLQQPTNEQIPLHYHGKARGLFVGCLTSQQHASVSQGWICSDNCTCCHTEIEVADQNFYLTQPQYTDTGPTSPSANPVTPGALQDSHWSANF